MNKVGCKCLNIIISSELDFCDVNNDQLELTIEENQDIFFQKNDLRQVEKLDKISKSLPGLVETREVGSWIIHYCINCKVHTHAVHKKKGASCVLINPTLLPEEDIDRLRHSENFSKAYKILINVEKFIKNKDDIFYPSEMDSLMTGIKQNATETLRKEAARIEEKIKKYTEDQYYLLDVLRERLSSEEQTLMRTVLDHFTQMPDRDDTHSYKFLRNDDVPLGIKKYAEKSSQAMSLNSAAVSPKKQKKTLEQGSDSDDLLFQFDGMDEKNSSDQEEFVDLQDEADEEAKASERHQTRGRSSSIKFAKSLPMDIPVFMRPKKHYPIDSSDDDSLPEEKNIDIAASIKKLAKSVHGSEIFGDLPRPRFSTQL